MSTEPPPFDELGYLSLLDRVREDQESAPPTNNHDLARLLHLSSRLVAENIRLREKERAARQQALLLEQGQTILFRPESKR